jgi:hypothetical protein
MTDLPPGPVPARPWGDAVPWEALEDLAAGALPQAEATVLRARMASDPAWARAFAEVETVQHALEAEGLFAFPRSLAARIVEHALGAPRLGWAGVAWRAAASVALAVSAWSAWVGGAPALPRTGSLPAWAQAPVDLPGSEVLASAPSVPAGAAPWAALGAVVLLGAGLALARRWGTGLTGGRSLLGNGRAA